MKLSEVCNEISNKTFHNYSVGVISTCVVIAEELGDKYNNEVCHSVDDTIDVVFKKGEKYLKLTIVDERNIRVEDFNGVTKSVYGIQNISVEKMVEIVDKFFVKG